MGKSLNIKTIEEIIFLNKKIHNLLPHHMDLINAWIAGYKNILLKFLKHKSAFELLSIIDEKDLKILADFYKEEVVLENAITKIIIDIKSSKESLESELPDDFNLLDMSCFRRKDEVKIVLWR